MRGELEPWSAGDLILTAVRLAARRAEVLELDWMDPTFAMISEQLASTTLPAIPLAPALSLAAPVDSALAATAQKAAAESTAAEPPKEKKRVRMDKNG